MKIGILGSGLMGAKLGTLWARAGHEVVFSYARTKGKLEELAREAGRNGKAGAPAAAVKDADAILLAVHWSRLDDVLKQAGDLSGKLVLSCSLPMNAADTGFVVKHDKSSGAEELAKRLPKAHIVSAFNTVPSEVFFDVFKGRKKSARPSLLYCGGTPRGKKTAAGLISDIGFEPLDLGELDMARATEPMAMVVAQLAYNGRKGPRMAYRFEWMGK
jgi:predicted dinucleotide-binding enzyme